MVDFSERLGETIGYSIQKYSAKTTLCFELKMHYSHMSNTF